MNYVSETIRLAWALAVVKFRQRIAGTYLGIFWYLLEPLIFFIILLSLQGNIGSSSISYYPAYLLLGLIMINFFTSVTSTAVGSVRENKNLIQSVNIKTEALPLSTVIQFCYSHFFEFLLFVAVLIFFGGLSWNIFWYPFIFGMYTIFILACSYILATIGIFIEDFHNIWNVVSRLLWLATPIFYTLTPGNLLYTANHINPLYYFLTVARDVVIYHTVPSITVFSVMFFGSLILLVFGITFFAKYKRKFAEFM